MTPIDLGPLMYDRGRGPELRSKRLTVYNVWDELLDDSTTDTVLSERYRITPEEVAALRTYCLDHFDEISEAIREMDERTAREIEAQNTPEKLARVRASRDRFKLRCQWTWAKSDSDAPERFPSFEEWLTRETAAHSRTAGT